MMNKNKNWIKKKKLQASQGTQAKKKFKNTRTQEHKSTRAQEHKNTRAQEHKNTRAQENMIILVWGLQGKLIIASITISWFDFLAILLVAEYYS